MREASKKEKKNEELPVPRPECETERFSTTIGEDASFTEGKQEAKCRKSYADLSLILNLEGVIIISYKFDRLIY